MRTRKNQLSAKYKTLRLPIDSLYGARIIQTFLNKFIRRGAKAVSRRQAFAVLTRYRLALRWPPLFFALIRLFHQLRIQFVLAYRRQAKNFVSVPFPVRRNKRDVINLQTLYKAISRRTERTLEERLLSELLEITFNSKHSATMRARHDHILRVFEERTEMDKR
jgi:ribosomal protein S7